MGATYKANCNDLRNSKSLEIFQILKKKIVKFIFLIQMLIKKMLVKLNF